MKVAVSFLKSKFDLKTTIDKIKQTDADFIHVDIMDGKFVPNKTVDYNNLKDYLTDFPLDVHLMVENPYSYIMEYKNLLPEFITIHSEINEDIISLINLIHNFNIKAGISIKPDTLVSDITKYLPYVENVLIMSVEPGKGGQEFNESVINKINELIKLRKENNYNYLISIDGGINNNTIKYVSNVDFVISGSFVCESDNYQQSIDSLR